MLLVRKVDGVWTPWTEPAEFSEIIAVCDKVYHDGRVERDVACEPYPRAVQLTPAGIEKALELGAWTVADLARFDLAEAVPFVPAAGKRKKGEARYEERDGAVYEVFDIEDVPAPPAPIVQTTEQKVGRLLKTFGLTKQELLDALKTP